MRHMILVPDRIMICYKTSVTLLSVKNNHVRILVCLQVIVKQTFKATNLITKNRDVYHSGIMSPSAVGVLESERQDCDRWAGNICLDRKSDPIFLNIHQFLNITNF